MVDAVPIHFPLPFLVAILTRGLDSSLLFAGIESMDRFVSRVQSGYEERRHAAVLFVWNG